MKNLKIALILLAAVAMFCSCSKDEDETTATANGLSLSVTGDVRELNVATMDDPTIATIKVTASDETNGLESISGYLYGICKANAVPNENLDGFLAEDELYQIIDLTSLYFDDFKKKENSYSTEMPYPFTKANVEEYAALFKSLRFSVTVVNRKENKSLMKEWTITLIAEEPEPETTALPTEWNPTKVVLCSQQQSGYGVQYEGIAAVVENETIGVKCDGKNDHKAFNMYAEPTTGASWVFVENIDNLTTNEALIEAYNNGEKVTERTMFPATDEGKGYQEKFFISKNKDGEYVLVDYVAGLMRTNGGNVMVFQYKKADVTPAPQPAK